MSVYLYMYINVCIYICTYNIIYIYIYAISHCEESDGMGLPYHMAETHRRQGLIERNGVAACHRDVPPRTSWRRSARRLKRSTVMGSPVTDGNGCCFDLGFSKSLRCINLHVAKMGGSTKCHMPNVVCF